MRSRVRLPVRLPYVKAMLTSCCPRAVHHRRQSEAIKFMLDRSGFAPALPRCSWPFVGGETDECEPGHLADIAAELRNLEDLVGCVRGHSRCVPVCLDSCGIAAGWSSWSSASLARQPSRAACVLPLSSASRRKMHTVWQYATLKLAAPRAPAVTTCSRCCSSGTQEWASPACYYASR